jgi:hypothetical protein
MREQEAKQRGLCPSRRFWREALGKSCCRAPSLVVSREGFSTTSSSGRLQEEMCDQAGFSHPARKQRAGVLSTRSGSRVIGGAQVETKGGAG